MFTAEDMRRYWPNSNRQWRDAFVEHHEEWGAKWDITTPRRWRHFLAQVSAETGGLSDTGKGGLPLKGFVENHRYSAARIREVFAYRLKKAARENPDYRRLSIAEIAECWARNPEEFFEGTYGDRPELGNVLPGDGYKFRGRGPIQLTGRNWYAKAGEALGIDLVSKPELVEDPVIGWCTAFFEWREAGCNALADRNDVVAVSKRINGGTNGLAHRRAWFDRAVQFFPDAETWQDYEARDEATLADLAKISRKAKVVKATEDVATVATATTGALAAVKGVKDAIAPPPAPPPAEIPSFTTITEKAGEITTGINTIKGLGEAISDVSTFAVGHIHFLVPLGTLAVAYVAIRLGRYLLEDYRAGKYQPVPTQGVGDAVPGLS